MKKQIKFLVLIVSVCVTEISFSQVTKLDNQRPASGTPFPFLGWDNITGTAGSLEIRNNFNRPIKFFTNTSQRAIVDSLGNFGIGITIPTTRLHVFDNTSLGSYFNPSTTVVGKFIAQNANATEQYAVIGESSQAASQNTGVLGNAMDAVSNIGVKGHAKSTVGLLNIGCHGEAGQSNFSNWGLFGTVDYYPTIDTCRLINAGVQANAEGSPYENRAGSFSTEGVARPAEDSARKGFNYSVWARSTAGETPAPWGTAPYYSAGHFLGDVFVLGSIISQPTDFMDIDTSKTKDIPADSALYWLSKLYPKSLYATTGLDSFPLGFHYGFDTDSVRHYVRAVTRDIFRPKGYANICEDSLLLEHDISIVPSEILPLVVAGVNQLKTSNYLWKESSGNVILTDTTWNVIIGAASAISGAKLEVLNDTVQTGAFISTARPVTGTVTNIGAYGNSMGASANPFGADIGVRGVAQNTSAIVPVVLKQSNVGVLGQGRGARSNYGGRFEASLSPTGGNYGVYAAAKPGWAGYFLGNVYRSGTDNFTSDIIFKDSISDIPPAVAIEILSNLQPKVYDFKTDSFPYMNLPAGDNHLGFIAQQVDTVLPGLVHTVHQPPILDSSGAVLQDSMSFKALSYTEIIPIAVAGINYLSEMKVSSESVPTDSNYLPKWSPTPNVLTNSTIYDNGKIGIGTTEPIHPLHVRNEADSFGIYALSAGSNRIQAGMVGESKNAGETNVGVAGFSASPASDTTMNIGIGGLADSSQGTNVGVYGFSKYSNSVSSNAGMFGHCGNSEFQNAGGVFIIDNEDDTLGTNYGIYASVPGSAPDYAAFLNGDVAYTGTPYHLSDSRLKNNIEDLSGSDAQSLLSRLQPKIYEFKRAEFPFLSLSEGKQYGLLAQDVLQVAPELVRDIIQPEIKDIKGNLLSSRAAFKAISYEGFITPLISANNEQQQIIDSLSRTTQDMEKRLTELEAVISGTGFRLANPEEDESGEETVNHLTVELSSMQYVFLGQNIPNPYDEQTTISYFIPEDAGSAQMLFFDLTGRTLKTVDVQKGYGIITVFAPNLSKGIYSYSLLIDGKVAETRKMVKTK